MKKFFRFLKLQKYKIIKIKDFPESVAIGIAWGVSVSFTPLLGFHLIICYLGTWLMRGNLIAATVGTIIGNPWTFPIIFYIDFKLGSYFLNVTKIEEFSLEILINNFEIFFLPTLFGSIPFAIVSWFITYYLIRNFLQKRINEKNKIRG